MDEGGEAGGVERPDADEQQQVQAHHDRKVVPDQPGGGARVPAGGGGDKETGVTVVTLVTVPARVTRSTSRYA